MAVLQVNNVSKSFEQEKLIENISLELHEGELVSLLGVSGGGKTTLFNIIAGLSSPDEGNVILDGADITQWNRTALGPDAPALWLQVLWQAVHGAASFLLALGLMLLWDAGT